MTKLELKVEMEEVRRARAFALSIADDAELCERQTQNLRLVVEEAVANIVNYSEATMMELCACLLRQLWQALPFLPQISYLFSLLYWRVARNDR